MVFSKTPLTGAFLIEAEPSEDARGQFYRTFCKQEFEAQGLPATFVQSSISSNRKHGTLRGMHMQSDPEPESKLVRCVRGAAYDVIVDLRRKSPTFCSWFGTELSASNKRAIFVPGGFAHGFQTLLDDTDLLYQMTEFYAPRWSYGVRWNDPAFKIKWPLEVAIMSEQDRSFPDFS